MASINRLSPILAIAVGVVHAGLAPVLAASDARPNIALVAVVLATWWGGSRAGATWAFVAGLTVNLFSAQPLGSISLSLLLAAAMTAAGGAMGATLGAAYPVVAVALGSVVADATILLIDRTIGGGPAGPVPVDIVAIGALLNATLAAGVLLAVWLVRREPARRGRVTR